MSKENEQSNKNQSKNSDNQDQNKKNSFERILQNYEHMNKMMINQMETMSAHNGLTGHFREQMWMEFFRSIIPKKYSLAQGVIIIDSEGNESHEVDIAAYDEQYTPYVFQYGSIKYIPIEAVALVISCKSKSFEKNEQRDWAKSIDELRTSRAGVARVIQGLGIGYTNESQTRTRPIKIIATLKEYSTDEPINFDDYRNQLEDYFDFIIYEADIEKEGKYNFQVKLSHEKRTLGEWFRALNQVEDKKSTDKQSGSDEQAESKSAENTGPKAELSIKQDVWNRVKDSVEQDKLLDVKMLDLQKPSNPFKDFKINNKLKDLEIEGNPLLTLNLQLNQLLMLINNPMWFPHYAYAKKFQEIQKRGKQK